MPNIETFLFQSNDRNVANLTTRNTFRVSFDTKQAFPGRNNTLKVMSANLWYTAPNIVGASLSIQVTDPSNPITERKIFIPDGLYDAEALNVRIKTLIQGSVGNDLESALQLSPDKATQKILLTFPYPGTTVIFNSALATVLGFPADLAIESSQANQFFFAPAEAKFNTYNYFLIKCTQIGDGIKINDTANQVIARVPINSPPGSLIHYEPVNPVSVPFNVKGIRELDFTVTDDLNRPVNFLGENWSIIVEILVGTT